jgi:acyl carrier protein
MTKLDEIERLLIGCINTTICELPLENQFEVNGSTLLLAEGGSIDSLQLVSIIVDFEEALSERFDIAVSLTSDEAMMQVESPFYSVKTLSNYAYKLIIV